jgi:hypothetical protein
MKLIDIRYITGLFMCLMFSATVFAQGEEFEVSGTVQDAKGIPVEGVSVLVQEKTQGIFTDKAGKFAVTTKGNDRLVFKKAGFNTIYMAAYDVKPEKSIVLQRSLIDAGDDDLVYIPFGTRTKRELTATISTATETDLPQLPLSTLNNALTGRLPGLYIQQTGN